MKKICDFDGCESEVCKEDLEYVPPTKQFCEEHSSTFNELIESGNIAGLLSLWVKSLGGAKKAAETM